MKTYTRLFLIISLLFIKGYLIYSQVTNITNELRVTEIAESTYIHTSGFNNGFVYVNNGEAIIVSTPDSDELTQELINWVQHELKAKIFAYVVDRWHPDAMEGLDVVQQNGIKSYACELTREIAKEKDLPVADIGFNPKLEIPVGKEKVVCHYLGPAHTSDGIVVWIPSEQILFGGNEIRNNNGWVGNIADANLSEWSRTAEKVKEEYGSAKIVVPGHGRHGGPELIDYTIQLYKPNKWGKLLRSQNINRFPVFNDFGNIFEVAEADSVSGELRYLLHATVFIDNKDRFVKVESPLIIHNVGNRSIQSDYGRLQIYSKSEEITDPIEDLYYNGLTINLRDDEVEIVIIIRRMVR